MIELKNISKQYCKETTILKDIDLCIEDGDYIALMGPSGAGENNINEYYGLFWIVQHKENIFLTEMKSQIILKKKKPDYEMKIWLCGSGFCTDK